MTPQKSLAIIMAGIRPQFPQSPWEASSEDKFDRLWPSLQAEYLRRADELLRKRGEG